MNKSELWLRLRSYHFDHLVPTQFWQHIAANFGGPNAFSKAFAAKIARKHGWKNQFALRAIEEYKKFVYLGITCNFQVTPSKIIDVVWHEHLLFTKGYRQFCAEVIEYDFDHFPELVAVPDQTGQFGAQYEETLALYKTEFNAQPPADIWATTKFNKETMYAENYEPAKKLLSRDSAGNHHYYGDAPLYTFFSGSSDMNGDNSTATAGEHEGGNFGGAGASGSWDSTANGDSGSADLGNADAGSDSGSSCSSGCGGGD